MSDREILQLEWSIQKELIEINVILEKNVSNVTELSRHDFICNRLKHSKSVMLSVTYLACLSVLVSWN
jgi:hypothetical protein